MAKALNKIMETQSVEHTGLTISGKKEGLINEFETSVSSTPAYIDF